MKNFVSTEYGSVIRLSIYPWLAFWLCITYKIMLAGLVNKYRTSSTILRYSQVIII